MKDVYVITGATGGMGVDLAHKITKKDIVLISDLDLKKLNALKKELTAKKITCEVQVCDISKKEDIDKLVAKTKKLGHFKALVHTAGVSESMQCAETILKINLVGTKMLMDAFYEIADNSVFINIASMMGHMVPDSALYNNTLLNPLDNNFFNKIKLFIQGKSQNAYIFSKKGVILLTENEVSKWALKKSRIVSISPGAIETPLALLESKDNPAVDFMIENTPIPRYGQPKEITDLVNFLISDKAEFITGIDVLIDGGITSHMKYNDIFGLKANKVDKITPIIIYLFTFLAIPLYFRLFFYGANLLSIQNSLAFFLNPAVVLLTTMFLNKEKISPYLVLLPFFINLIASRLVFGEYLLVTSLFYLSIALLVSYLVTIYKKNKKN